MTNDSDVRTAGAAHHPGVRWRRLAMLGLVGVAADHRERRRLVGRNPLPRSWRRLVPDLRRPVFIIGAPRTGTTFLGSRIGRLSEFSYHFEPRLTKAAVALIHDGTWSNAGAARVFKANYRLLQGAALQGGSRFAEKNPENCFVVPFLGAAFPTATFVHIVRDGRDAAVSLAAKPWLAAGSAGSGLRGRGDQEWGPYPRFWVEPERRTEFRAVSDLERAAWCWRRFTNAALEGLGTLPDERVLQVRYEEVVTAPEVAAEQLADFLLVDRAGRDQLRAAMSAADPASIGRWRRLDAGQLAAVTGQTGPVLRRLGYTDD